MNPAALRTPGADVNALLVCEFSPPISLDLPRLEQVEWVLNQPSIVQSNRSMAKLCRYRTPEEMYGRSLAEVLHHAIDDPRPMLDIMRRRLLDASATGYQQEGIEARWQLAAHDERRDFQVSYHGLVGSDGLQRLVILHRDETERRRQEQLVFNIAQQLSLGAEDGHQEFFNRLVEQLAHYLNVTCVIVGELIDGSAPGDSIRTLGCWHEERLQPEWVYPLAGGPCANVVGREVCSFPRRVAARFPQDAMLQEMQAEAYMGVPLFGDGGRQIGILCLLHTQTLADEQLARSLLTIFSLRAAAELERLQRDRARELRAARRHVFFDVAPHGMCVLEVDPPMPANLPAAEQQRWLRDHGRYVECNTAYARLVDKGDPQTLLQGKNLQQLHGENYLQRGLQALIQHDFQLQDVPLKFSDDEGRELWFAYTVSAVYTEAGLSRLLTVAANITDRMQYTRQIEHRARHDSLTGLPNRAYFYEVVEQHLLGETATLAVFILDLDGFKEVNDTLGHEVGDHLLREIGPRLQQAVGDRGTLVARLGGDEFSVLYPEYGDFAAVQALADAMVAEIRRPFRVLDLDLVIDVSTGIALYPEQGDSANALMRCADIAMYQAKRNSRPVELYRRDLDHYTVRRLALMMDIRQAIDSDELYLVYQPIVELKSGRVLGFEALLRWRHPEHGLLLPAEFIPLIELTDMMESVTWWVLENGVRALRDWQRRGWNFQLSINISTRNIGASGFAERVKGLLREQGLSGESVLLEITESALMADPDHARRVLQSLAEVGIRSCIDDYGTGYSSLAYLRSLPIHSLKIDRTFISQMLDSELDRIIVTSTVQLAHNLGLQVTAEGVESNAVLAELRGLGCDWVQGFFIAQPLANEDIANWVALHERLRSSFGGSAGTR